MDSLTAMDVIVDGSKLVGRKRGYQCQSLASVERGNVDGLSNGGGAAVNDPGIRRSRIISIVGLSPNQQIIDTIGIEVTCRLHLTNVLPSIIIDDIVATHTCDRCFNGLLQLTIATTKNDSNAGCIVSAIVSRPR